MLHEANGAAALLQWLIKDGTVRFQFLVVICHETVIRQGSFRDLISQNHVSYTMPNFLCKKGSWIRRIILSQLLYLIITFHWWSSGHLCCTVITSSLQFNAEERRERDSGSLCYVAWEFPTFGLWNRNNCLDNLAACNWLTYCDTDLHLPSLCGIKEGNQQINIGLWNN